ncbi:helix-turn-helix domain-containing protein [Streptomyces sp. GSL17-111]|uniref:helix-turn-helix domain-containing protein n=1 Tax=Streptomyces sp. GSL17-111 TaxID=3121596 RepID=UPI0030F4A67D
MGTEDRRALAPELSRELRRLRKARGLTLAALARRTSYSKSSWERYLNAKALPPEQAVIAFARTTGASPHALLALRGLAERSAAAEDVDAEPGQAEGDAVRAEAPEDNRDGEQGDAADGVAASPVDASPDEAPPTRADVPERDHTPRTAPEPAHEPASTGGAGPVARLRRWPRAGVIAAVAGVAVLSFAAGLLLGRLPGGSEETGTSGTADAVGAIGTGEEGSPQLPGCTDFECRAQDPQRLGCHIGVWTAALTVVEGAHVELRYSPACRAAWSRVTEAEVGDVARVEGEDGVAQERAIRYDGDTYSPMIEAPFPGAVRACALLLDGREVCTDRGGNSPLPVEPEDESVRDG